MAQPLLTIAILTRSQAGFLAQLLGPLLYQIKGRLEDRVEVVIADDGSTDNTPAIGAHVTGLHSFVKFYRHGNPVGVAANFAFAAKRASGTFCWIIDAQNVILDGAVDTVLRQLKRGDPDFLMVNRKVADGDLNLLLDRQMQIAADKDFAGIAELARDIGVVTNIAFTSAVVFRRDAYLQVNAAPYHVIESGYPQIGPFFEAFRSARCRAVADLLVCERNFGQRPDAEIKDPTLLNRAKGIGLLETFLLLHRKGVVVFSEIEHFREEPLSGRPGERMPIVSCGELCLSRAAESILHGRLGQIDVTILGKAGPLFEKQGNRLCAEALRQSLLSPAAG